MHISTPDFNEGAYDTKALYEEFKSFIKAPAFKKPKYKIEMQYKKLYSEIQIAKNEKKKMLESR